MEPKDRKNLPMRLEAHKRIKRAALDAGVTMQDYVEVMLEATAGNPAKVPVRTGGETLTNTGKYSAPADMLPKEKRFLDALVSGLRSGDPTVKTICAGLEIILKDKGYAGPNKAGKRSKHQAG